MSTATEDLLVADSFRVRAVNGQTEVRGLDRHLARFEQASREATGKQLDELARFTELARVRIAAYGAGWPRLELWRHEDRHTELRLALRKLPDLGDQVELRTTSAAGQRTPQRKGPNIAAYSALNREVGAEAMLLDGTGHVLEGATTSLVWWHGDTLCTVTSTERVPSVTEALILKIALDEGMLAESQRVTPRELATYEVWAVNALHGIRTVTAIDGFALAGHDEKRLRKFRDALDRTWQPVIPVRPARPAN